MQVFIILQYNTDNSLRTNLSKFLKVRNSRQLILCFLFLLGISQKWNLSVTNLLAFIEDQLKSFIFRCIIILSGTMFMILLKFSFVAISIGFINDSLAVFHIIFELTLVPFVIIIEVYALPLLLIITPPSNIVLPAEIVILADPMLLAFDKITLISLVVRVLDDSTSIELSI
jgi:hypothetical protein